MKVIPKKGAATVIRIYNTGFAEWTVENFGRLSGEKKIPAWLFGAERHHREAFLQGSHLADGNVGRFEEAGIATTSKRLAFGLRSLIESLGNSAIINVKDGRRSARGHANLYRAGWRLNPRNEHTEVHDGLRWMPIKSVSDLGPPQVLHDIALDGGWSCVAEGIIAATRQPSAERPAAESSKTTLS